MLKIKYKGVGAQNLSALKDSIVELIMQKIAVNFGVKKNVTIVYPYIVHEKWFKLKLIVLWLGERLRLKLVKDEFRFLIGVNEWESVLFISHENLERAYWWNNLGKYIVNSDIPRLTFWPKHLDPCGERFPYWYNYIDWPEYTRKNPSLRYGKFLKIERLMKPLPKDSHRKNRAAYVGSHMDFPRAGICEAIENSIEVDKYGKEFSKPIADKFEVIKDYMFSFCPENSSGYGYDTEKVPEAWNAGCVPIGYYINAYSDFNYALLNSYGEIDPELCFKYPLLSKKPVLDDVEKYLKDFILG